MTQTPQRPSLAWRLIRGVNPVQRPKLLAGVLAAVAAFGIYLGTKLPDFNLGAGGGGGIGLGGSEQASLSTDSSSAKESPKKTDAKGLGGTEILDVVVDGPGYALRNRSADGDEYVPITLPELVALARETPGNRDGVRVRVYRRGSALPVAEDALLQALEGAGLPEHSVQPIDGVLK